MSDYRIDTALNIPIYRQVADKIRAEIKSGRLKAGAQLPTVRELAERLRVARGSVKRAYDELEKEKLVEKAQGKGTFVAYRPIDSDSRKERAVALIDQLLNQLEDMEFSAREINIFIGLKLRERAQRQAKLKVALLECNPETLSQLGEQLHAMFQIDLYPYLLHEVLAYPYKIDEDMDLIVVPEEHAEAFTEAIARPEKTAKIALRPTTQTVAAIVKIPEEETVGILCRSERFGSILTKVCRRYAEQLRVAAPCLLDDAAAVEAYLNGKTTLLVPSGYEKYAQEAVAERLRRFRSEHALVECTYKIDEGSLIYLKEKMNKLTHR